MSVRKLAIALGVPRILHPFRGLATWACQRGVLTPRVRRFVPWTWVLEPFTVYGDGWSFPWYPTMSDTVGMTLFWHGLRGFEKETVPIMLDNLRTSRCFVDIGANSGIYTVMGCTVNPNLRVVAVEPVRRVHETLINNVSRNGLDARVTILNLALGDSNGVVRFNEAEDPTMGSIHSEDLGPPTGKIIDVECRTLDSVVAELNVAPDFLKIDVEGFEHAVLRGGRKLLTQVRPRIVLEANPGGPARELTEILAEHGYEFYNLTDGGLEPKSEVEPVEAFRNWLCVPK